MLVGLFFMFSNFYRLDVHNKTRVAIANLRRKLCKNRIENHTSPSLVIVIRSACLLVSLLNTHALPIVFTIECRVVITI